MTQVANPTGEESDRDLERRIWNFLESHHVPSLRHVRVEAVGGLVSLRGRVGSFYAKQLVQHSARRIAGEGRVVDEIEVATPTTFRDAPPLRRLAAAGASLVVLLAAAGCSKSEPPRVPVQPVSGQVILDGRPAKGAWVVFHAKGATETFPSPTACTDPQGNFSLGTYSSDDGAPTGEYTITVRLQPMVVTNGEYQPGPDQVPPKYRSPKTSTLAARVTEGANSVPVKLTR